VAVFITSRLKSYLCSKV